MICAEAGQGLTAEQAARRVQAGLANLPVDPPGRSAGEIVRENIFTYFNGVFVALALCLVAVRASLLNLSFLGVVVINTVIGIVQELRSKKTLDKLTVVAASRVICIRDGREQSLEASELVRDDVICLTAGSQVCADGVVLTGECRVNEALVTGEADEILKRPGDSLLSGSFLVSGSCRARLTAVGAASFASRLTVAAKEQKGERMGEMMRSLTNLVKYIGFAILPFGALLAVKEIVWLGRDMTSGVTSTVGALIGMIPEGIYLLTSLALAAGLLRLARKKTLCHEMECIETLARVDVLCVDKTGTVTENKMAVEDVVLLCPDRFVEEDIRLIMADYVAALPDDNETMAALRCRFAGEARQTAAAALPFTSERKYGGVSFDAEETYVLGAPEVILGEEYPRWQEQVERYSARGCRVLLLSLYSGVLGDGPLEGEQMPLALLLLANKIRAEAPDTFAYFARQGVTVKVISGDSPLTVSQVAGRAGIPGAERWVDARTLDDEEALFRAAGEYTVFGRVKPEQKRQLVRALQAQGHTVAMTGDGVNDVLALKEADCSIAMASGSDVACQVSQIVLLDSDFSALPSVVDEGRRVINNIQRSAALYLVKNIFSFVMAVITLLFMLPYPLVPAQLGLVNYTSIGIPSFVLAMEPNHERVRGRFLPNVIRAALPAALTDLVLAVGIMLFYLAFDLDDSAMSTICTGVMGVVGLMTVHRLCRPYNRLRRAMMIFLAAAYGVSFLFLRPLFNLAALDFAGWLVLAVFALLAWPAMNVLDRGVEKLWALGRARGRRRRKA